MREEDERGAQGGRAGCGEGGGKVQGGEYTARATGKVLREQRARGR